MDLSTKEIFFLLDLVSWLVMILCITKLVVILYRIAKMKITDIDVVDFVAQQKEFIVQKNEELKDSIKHSLAKQENKSFELYQNTLKAQEKRLKEYIDERFKKQQDEKKD